MKLREDGAPGTGEFSWLVGNEPHVRLDTEWYELRRLCALREQGPPDIGGRWSGDDSPQDCDEDCDKDAAGEQEDVEEKNVHDDWADEDQAEDDVAVCQQQEAAYEFNCRYEQIIVRLDHGAQEVACQSWRELAWHEVQKTV